MNQTRLTSDMNQTFNSISPIKLISMNGEKSTL